MSAVEWLVASPRKAAVARAALQRAVMSPRFFVYALCTLLALVTAWRLGKDMQWDTLDYHLYAGFSAIHDRFGVDYFAAGPQSYLNPYAYAPFYLLATSGLSALDVAAILAVVQSAILWLTYELAIAVIPTRNVRGRIAVGTAAALLAFANPVLMEQFGSSFADITTAEVVLAGALVLIGAVRSPSVWRVACAGILLGAASALKLTNSLDALSLAVVPLFMSIRWIQRLRSTALYVLSAGVSFVLVAVPWSMRLERHFGNPLFPLFNGLFHSPEYTTARLIDYRFIPNSFVDALWRPFAMMAPIKLVHFERPAPDLRYALLIMLAVLLVLARSASRMRAGRAHAGEPRRLPERRAQLALGCAFVIGWAIWLTESDNSRYFLPMACVAAVLLVALVCRLFAAWPRVAVCMIAVILVGQLHQVAAGTSFRPLYPWEGERWFDVSIPTGLTSQPSLYFSVGMQSSSFVVPFLPVGSGFINLKGDYVLGPDGANGTHIRQMIAQFSPNLRVLVADSRADAARDHDVPHLANVDDAVEPFGLRVDSTSCVRILVHGAPTLEVVTVGRALPNLPRSAWYTGYLVTCRLVPDAGQQDQNAWLSTKRTADLVLDRLEDACPSLFQPRRPETYFTGSDAHSHFWVRQYPNTDLVAWIHLGRVGFQKVTEGRAQDAGSVLAWEKSPLKVVCGPQRDGVFLRILQPGR